MNKGVRPLRVNTVGTANEPSSKDCVVTLVLTACIDISEIFILPLTVDTSVGLIALSIAYLSYAPWNKKTRVFVYVLFIVEKRRIRAAIQWVDQKRR